MSILTRFVLRLGRSTLFEAACGHGLADRSLTAGMAAK
jgi:hypothetical protein